MATILDATRQKQTYAFANHLESIWNNSTKIRACMQHAHMPTCTIVRTINMHVYTFTASHTSSMYNAPCTNVGKNSMLSNHHILLVKLRLNPPSNRFNPCDLVTAKSPFGAFSESKLWLKSCIWQHLQLFGFHFDHLIQQFQGNTSCAPKQGPASTSGALAQATSCRATKALTCCCGPESPAPCRNHHVWPYINIYGYGSIPINTIFSGMNIHKSQLFWCSLGVLLGVPGFDTLPYIYIYNYIY